MTDVISPLTFDSALRDLASTTRYNYHRGHPHIIKSSRYQPYQLDRCVNCKKYYHFDRLEQDRDWDNDTWPVIGKHWSSCENRILPRVSGLRATLKDSEGTSKDSTAISRAPNHHSLYPRLAGQQSISFTRTSYCHAHLDSTPTNITERLNPSFSRHEVLPPILPERYTPPSSHIFIQPHFPPLTVPHHQLISTRSTDTIPILSKEPSPSVVTRLTPHTRSVHKETLKRLYSSPPEGVLPPALDRKRKRAQNHEDDDDDSDEDNELHNVNGLPASTLSYAVQSQESDKRFQKRALKTPVPAKSSPNNTSGCGEHPKTSSRDLSAISNESTTAKKPTRKRKKSKTNEMDWRVRRRELEDDPLIGEVDPTEVFCIGCQKWVSLDARNGYYPGLWKKHKETMHEYNGDGTLKLIPKRRRKNPNKKPSSKRTRKSV